MPGIASTLTALGNFPVAAATTVPSRVESTTAYTLALADAGLRVKFTHQFPITVTVPPVSAVAWPPDTVIYLMQFGANAVSVVPGAGVTINTPASKVAYSLETYTAAVLTYEGSDTWTLGGALSSTIPVPINTNLYGGDGWDAVNNLGTAVGAGITGHATNGIWMAVLFSSTGIPATQGYFTSSLDGISAGYGIRHNNAFLDFGINSFASISPAYNLQAGDLNKTQLMVFQWDGANLRTYFARNEIGSAVAAASYAPSPGSLRQSFGTRDNGNQPVDSVFTIYGIAGGNTAITLGEVEALYDAVKVENDIVSIPGKTTGLWSVTQDQVDANFPNGLTDQVGSADMVFYNGVNTGINLQTHIAQDFGW